MTTCDFATFCYQGDTHRLHKPGHLEMMVSSNKYPFNQVMVVYQLCNPNDYPLSNIRQIAITDIDSILRDFGIDLDKPQYASNVDKHHTWKQHVVNHLAAINVTEAEYIVFADSDCWMIRQPANHSWIDIGIEILETQPDVFIVSPNDGEESRLTQTISQQMFMVRTNEFRNMDWNQPGWDGNVRVEGGPFPEYYALLEGRMGIYCKYTNRYRYVLPSDYRYWHHNRLDENGYYITDTSKY